MATDGTPRGIRNNNPGNLDKLAAPQPWQGLADLQDDPRFYKFKDPIYGIRALARTLIAYQDQHDLRSIDQIITRWAPPVENDTKAYAKAVSSYTGFTAYRGLNMHSFDDLRGVTEAIIQHENGQMPYSEAQIAKALTLAGVEAPKKAFLATPQILGSALAGAATVAQPVVDGIQKQLEPLVGYSDKLKTLFVVVSLIGIVVVAIAKYDERRKGIS